MDLDKGLQDISFRYARFRFAHNQEARYRVYRKLQGMLAMNESLGRALERLWYNATEMGRYPTRPSAIALRSWLDADRMGRSLSEAMAGWAPINEVFMIRAGEESGAINRSLEAILQMGDQGREMRQAIMSAVSYPLFMLVMIGGVFWMFGVNLIKPMREFAPKLVERNMKGLALTSEFVTDYGIYIGIAIIATIAGIAASMPVWRGHLRSKIDMYPPYAWYRLWQGSAFLLSLSSLLSAQVPLKRALEVLEEHGNPWLEERISAARTEILRGRNLGEALRVTELNFPDPVVALDLEILSERSDIGEVLQLIADEWMRDQIGRLQTQSAIVRYAGMAGVGGIIAWAMLSIISVTTSLSSGTSSF